MRDLSATKLEATQKQDSLDPIVKITLTNNGTTVTLREDRIKNLPRHHEEPYEVDCEVVLDNSDGYFTDLDLKGYDAVVSYGLVTKDGEEFSDTSPLKVIAQRLDSSEGKLICTLIMEGIPNMLAEDRASANYKPDADDNKTVKTLIREIAGDSGVTHLACFNHTPKYDVVFDSEDSLIDSYKPKDSFWILVNDASGKRLTALRKLLDYTHCVPRWGGDGKIHILQPTTSGDSYNYEYSLEDHIFFGKALRITLVIPNKIIVSSKPDDDPQYTGSATDTTSYALLPKEEYRQYRLVSNDEAADLADAILSKYQLSAEMGAATVPMNVGQEIFDYVKVTDEREDDYRIGNIGSLTRSYSPGKYTLSFSFGAWLTVRKILSDLEIGGVDFEQLSVGTLYAKHILLSDVADDANYRRTKATSITAEGMVILDQVIEGTYGLTKKASLTAEGLVILEEATGTVDDIEDGATYQRTKAAALTAEGLILVDELIAGDFGLVLSTDISAGHILLSSAVKDGEWYNESGVEIDANHGINIYGQNNALTTRATKTGAIQCYVGSDGSIRAGGGDIILDNSGITLKGDVLAFKNSGGATVGHIAGGAGYLGIWSYSGNNLILTSYGDYIDMHYTSGYLKLPTYPGDVPSAPENSWWYDSTNKRGRCYTNGAYRTVP